MPSCVAEFERGGDIDAAPDAAIDGAPGRVMLVGAARGIALVLGTALEPVADSDPLDDQHPAFDLDLALGF